MKVSSQSACHFKHYTKYREQTQNRLHRVELSTFSGQVNMLRMQIISIVLDNPLDSLFRPVVVISSEDSSSVNSEANCAPSPIIVAFEYSSKDSSFCKI